MRRGRINRLESRGLSNRLESLERRQLLAAHVAGDPTVYATIQAAVNAAAPNAIVNVDAGDYPEVVVINKPLTVRGAQSGVDARSNLRANAAAPANESVLSGVDLNATDHAPCFLDNSD